MRVKMQTILAGPEYSAQPGQVINLPDKMADDLISGGYATPVRDKTIETALLKTPEYADFGSQDTGGEVTDTQDTSGEVVDTQDTSGEVVEDKKGKGKK